MSYSTIDLAFETILNQKVCGVDHIHTFEFPNM